MKYIRLTKEQLEELHPEFVNFLATQSIDKAEWDQIKTNKPEVALQEIDVFSDLIWEKALTNVKYVDHFSKNYIFLFHCHQDFLESLIIKTNNAEKDFFTTEGIEWLTENLFSDEIEIQTGKKIVNELRNDAVFDIIQKGGVISNGDLYSNLNQLIQNQK
jgi:hypothetical protein